MSYAYDLALPVNSFSPLEQEVTALKNAFQEGFFKITKQCQEALHN